MNNKSRVLFNYWILCFTAFWGIKGLQSYTDGVCWNTMSRFKPSFEMKPVIKSALGFLAFIRFNTDVCRNCETVESILAKRAFESTSVFHWPISFWFFVFVSHFLSMNLFVFVNTRFGFLYKYNSITIIVLLIKDD